MILHATAPVKKNHKHDTRDRTTIDTMADNNAAPKPISSVKLVLLGEAAVGKVRIFHVLICMRTCS